MLFDLHAALVTHHLPARRVVHVGGHRGQEGAVYRQLGSQVTWIEPLPECAAAIQQAYPEHTVVATACGATWGVQPFYVATNEQSSSLLAPKKHLEHYPYIKFAPSRLVPVVPLDAIVQDTDGLVLDVQGAERLVLEGAATLLQRAHWVCAEVNQAELYAQCAQIADLDALLSSFIRVITVWRDGKDWGDAFWVRKPA